MQFPSRLWTLILALQSFHPNKRSSTDFDVIIVGGGYSGLMSAYTLQQAGLQTLVLEARDRVGGKSRTQTLRSGPGVIELGATWINNKTQPAVFALTRRFGLKTLEQYTHGDTITQGGDGAVKRIPPQDAADVNNFSTEIQAQFIALVMNAAEKINLRNFSNFPEREDVSFQDWIGQQGLWEYPETQILASEVTSTLVGREPDEIGAHYFLDYIKSGHGLQSLTTEGRNGAQSLMLEQGTTSVATSLVNAMKSGSVLMNTPVTKVVQLGTNSVVTAGVNMTFTARKIILAITPHTYANIEFSPPLPCSKRLIVARSKPGVYAKVILTYTEPWWRAAGLVGKFQSAVGPIRFSWETSNPALSQYSLAIFIAGDSATCWHAFPGSKKEAEVVKHLASLVGKELASKAQNVLEINYMEWTKEDFILGAPTAGFGPGMLRKYGTAFRQPFGDLHFAGTELAYEWKGYLEGAITSGQRAAEEIIETFSVKD
ncbi:amine oxidase [Phaeosphaeriaceae sp. PMI808]|nr:amine oxidase [Phaeosphaeriaceae sp. PMI808]